MSTVTSRSLVPVHNLAGEESAISTFSLILELHGSVSRRSKEDTFITSTSLDVGSLSEIKFFDVVTGSFEASNVTIPLSQLIKGGMTLELQSSRSQITNHITFLLFNNEDVGDPEKGLATHNVVELTPALVKSLTCKIGISPVEKTSPIIEHPSQISLGKRFKATVASENSKQPKYTAPKILFSVDTKIEEDKNAVAKKKAEEARRLEEKILKRRKLIREFNPTAPSLSSLGAETSKLYCCSIL